MRAIARVKKEPRVRAALDKVVAIRQERGNLALRFCINLPFYSWQQSSAKSGTN